MELATVPVTVVITDKLDDEDNKPSLEKTRFEAKNTDLTPLFLYFDAIYRVGFTSPLNKVSNK